MKKKYPAILALTLAVVTANSGFAEQSQAELLKQAEVTKSQAEKTALTKVPHGKIQSAEVENEHHALVWSFDITTPGSRDITEVLVNARTGKIVSISAENPARQAKESAADKATGAH